MTDLCSRCAGAVEEVTASGKRCGVHGWSVCADAIAARCRREGHREKDDAMVGTLRGAAVICVTGGSREVALYLSRAADHIAGHTGETEPPDA